LYIAAWAAAIAGMSLLAVRVWNSFSFNEPLLLFTSGGEDEPVYGIWKAMKGQKIYTDWHKPPFTVSYYGWLFYSAYGCLTRWCCAILSLSENWIPTVIRGITLCMLPFLMACIYRILRTGARGAQASSAWQDGALSIALAASPIHGWWLLSGRVDIAAALVQLVALLAAIQYRRTPTRIMLFSVIVLAYFAWSLKPICVHLISGFCLWLMAVKNYRALAACVITTFTLYALTFWCLNPEYYVNIIEANSASTMSFARALTNVGTAAIKSPFLISGFLIGVHQLFRYSQSTWLQKSADQLLFPLTLVFGIAWDFYCFLHFGSSSNYCFFSTIVATVITLKLFRDGMPVSPPRCSAILLPAILFFQTISALVPLLGIRGTTNVFASHQLAQRGARLIESAPKPVFATCGTLNLPWVNPSSPHAVINLSTPPESDQADVFLKNVTEIRAWLKARTFRAFLIDRTNPSLLDSIPKELGFSIIRTDGPFDVYAAPEKP